MRQVPLLAERCSLALQNCCKHIIYAIFSLASLFIAVNCYATTRESIRASSTQAPYQHSSNPQPQITRQTITAAAVAARQQRHSYSIHYHNLYLLELYGNNLQQMGADYGRLTAQPLRAFTHSILQAVQQRHLESAASRISHALYQHYPRHWQRFLAAMAHTAHIPLRSLLVTNSFEHLAIFDPPHRAKLPSTPNILAHKRSHQPSAKQLNFGCAELFFPGHTSTKRQLTPDDQFPQAARVLRWYDYFKGHPNWRNKLTITVFHLKHHPAVAMITYLGTLNATTLISQDGLFMALNNAKFSAWRLPKKYQQLHYEHAFSCIQLLDDFLQATTWQQFDRLMYHHRASLALIYNLMDSRQHQLLSYEVTPYKSCRLKFNGINYFSSTNHFNDQSCWHDLWRQPRFNNTLTSATYARQQHLNAQARQIMHHPHQLNTQHLQQILLSNLAHRGATRDITVMQLLYQNHYGLWIRVPMGKNPRKDYTQAQNPHSRKLGKQLQPPPLWQFISQQQLFA